MNIVEEIFRRCNPNAVAVIEKGVGYTYKQLDELTSEIAQDISKKNTNGLYARIGLRCRDGYNYVALALGILRANACFVPIASEITDLEQETLVVSLNLNAVITGEGLRYYVYDPIDCKEPKWKRQFDSLNPALIRFSSGTTGESKGVLLSHETLIERITAANVGLKIGANDRVLWVLGMSHHFAVSILLYLWNGAAIVLPESHLAGDLLTVAKAHHVSVLYASPFHYILLTAGNDKIHWPTLRLAISTTASLPEDVARRFTEASGIHPAQALGIIEVGLPFININEPEKRPTSIGKPQSDFEVLLISDDGNPSPIGQPGELFVKGPGIFDAYIEPWKNKDELLLDGGWFSTGDLAVADKEGYYYLKGRIKSVINIGGMKFFPEEVEKVICMHSSVEEARVFSRQHPHFGSIPIAEVVVSSDIRSAEILSICRRHLARYKIPAEIVFVESIPKTPSGKILRR